MSIRLLTWGALCAASCLFGTACGEAQAEEEKAGAFCGGTPGYPPASEPWAGISGGSAPGLTGGMSCVAPSSPPEITREFAGEIAGSPVCPKSWSGRP